MNRYLLYLNKLSHTLKFGGLLALLVLDLYAEANIKQTTKFNNPFIIKGSEIINQKANFKMLEIGLEVKAKTQTSIYIYALKSFDLDPNLTFKEKKEAIKNKKQQIIRDNNLSKSYAMIIYADKDKYVTIVHSHNLDGKIDVDAILDEYVVPLIASFDKNSKLAKITAGLFNGYAEIADEIADAYGVKFKTNISSNNKTFSDIWRKIMYVIIISGIIAYFIAIRRQKKYLESVENEKNKNTNKEESSKED
jgi:hypothetical protein